jgi:hypothetical protein
VEHGAGPVLEGLFDRDRAVVPLHSACSQFNKNINKWS